MSKNIFTLLSFEEFPIMSDFVEKGVIDSKFLDMINRLHADLVLCLGSKLPVENMTVNEFLSIYGLKCPIGEFLDGLSHSVKDGKFPVMADRVKLIEDLDRGLEECPLPCAACPTSHTSIKGGHL